MLRTVSILTGLLLLATACGAPPKSDTTKTQKEHSSTGDPSAPPAMDAPEREPPAMDAPAMDAAMRPATMEAGMNEPPLRRAKNAPLRPKSHAKAVYTKCTNCHKIGAGSKPMPQSHKGRSLQSCKSCHRLTK